MRAVQREVFGQLAGGEEASLFTLESPEGYRARICDFGATLVSLEVPDHQGVLGDVVLGYHRLQDYEDNPAYLGATIGRVAGRIPGGQFTVDGKCHSVGCNSEDFCLHGGERGFSHRLWTVCSEETSCFPQQPTVVESIELALRETAPVNGFPGTVDCRVRYSLNERGVLAIDYWARSTHRTPFNPTHHSYFNLAGQGDVQEHTVQLACSEYVVSVTQERRPVEAGFNDYRRGLRLKDQGDLLVDNGDFFAYLPGARTTAPRFAARVSEPTRGRVMEVHTTEPGIVFYAGLALGDGAAPPGKGGVAYAALAGLCLETQDYANSINRPDLGRAILDADETFRSRTEYRFGVA